MTLTELRYVVAVAREQHFGKAASACFVSQPTLSIAIKKLEAELGVILFERRQHEVTVTALGKTIIEQAQRVLEQAEAIKLIAREGKDPLTGEIRVGVIYNVGPYLLPDLIPVIHRLAPRISLIIEEGFTADLKTRLKHGEIDIIIISLPFAETGIATTLLYREPFMVAMPVDHPLTRKKHIKVSDLLEETLLLLKAGNCFRDQVMDVCPAFRNETFTSLDIQKTLEGSSLETIRQMVAAGVGVTVMPCTSIDTKTRLKGLLAYRPFVSPVPYRDIAIACRNTFPRMQTVRLLTDAVQKCKLSCIDKA